MIPAEIRHSGILSLQYMREIGRGDRIFFMEKPVGTEFIMAIADRCTRGRIVRRYEYESIALKAAKRIYDDDKHVRRFFSNHCPTLRSKCGHRAFGGLILDGELVGYESEFIPIYRAPTKPCRWCGKAVEFKPNWLKPSSLNLYGTVHCNAPDCRRMDWLSNKPQKHGGINLTPRQREETDYEARDTVRAFNYLQLRIKEAKRNGRKPTYDIR